MLTFRFGGVELSSDDFKDTLRDWVAYSIGFTGGTRCRDKKAALELLRYEADQLIEQAKSGKWPRREYIRE